MPVTTQWGCYRVMSLAMVLSSEKSIYGDRQLVHYMMWMDRSEQLSTADVLVSSYPGKERSESHNNHEDEGRHQQGLNNCSNS